MFEVKKGISSEMKVSLLYKTILFPDGSARLT